MKELVDVKMKKKLVISISLFFSFLLIGFLCMYLIFERSGIDYAVPFEPIRAELSFIHILVTNLSVLLIGILGVFTFRITSILILIVNGISLGGVLAANILTSGNISYYVRIVLIHGCTEILAIVLACSIGLFGKEYFKAYSRRAIRVHISSVVLLCVLSAVIETNLTPLFW